MFERSTIDDNRVVVGIHLNIFGIVAAEEAGFDRYNNATRRCKENQEHKTFSWYTQKNLYKNYITKLEELISIVENQMEFLQYESKPPAKTVDCTSPTWAFYCR